MIKLLTTLLAIWLALGVSSPVFAGRGGGGGGTGGAPMGGGAAASHSPKNEQGLEERTEKKGVEGAEQGKHLGAKKDKDRDKDDRTGKEGAKK